MVSLMYYFIQCNARQYDTKQCNIIGWFPNNERLLMYMFYMSLQFVVVYYMLYSLGTISIVKAYPTVLRVPPPPLNRGDPFDFCGRGWGFCTQNNFDLIFIYLTTHPLKKIFDLSTHKLFFFYYNIPRKISRCLHFIIKIKEVCCLFPSHIPTS